MEYKIYTAGYNNFLSDQFKAKVDELNLTIMDIRYAPWSNQPFWTRKYLESTYQKKYTHLGNLGNRLYKKKDEIEIVDIEGGIEYLKRFVNAQMNFVLLCACPEYSECHRKYIIDELKKHINFIHEELMP